MQRHRSAAPLPPGAAHASPQPNLKASTCFCYSAPSAATSLSPVPENSLPPPPLLSLARAEQSSAMPPRQRLRQRETEPEMETEIGHEVRRGAIDCCAPVSRSFHSTNILQYRECYYCCEFSLAPSPSPSQLSDCAKRRVAHGTARGSNGALPTTADVRRSSERRWRLRPPIRHDADGASGAARRCAGLIELGARVTAIPFMRRSR